MENIDVYYSSNCSATEEFDFILETSYNLNQEIKNHPVKPY